MRVLPILFFVAVSIACSETDDRINSNTNPTMTNTHPNGGHDHHMMTGTLAGMDTINDMGDTSIAGDETPMAGENNPHMADMSIMDSDGGTTSGTDSDQDMDMDIDPPTVTCVSPMQFDTTDTSEFESNGERASVSVDDESACYRTWTLSSTAPLMDNLPGSPRIVRELEGLPTLRTGHHLFDALFALALEEARECSVAQIRDGSFNNGQPTNCGEGGCFETGRKWNYVWTRDTAYAVDLGLAALDPIRAKNSLSFKLSSSRNGIEEEIVQDTGTGGSWPVSTDRVSWAMGAWALLAHLTDEDGGNEFHTRTLSAIANTLERDRLIAFDPTDGLYQGEQSFLDWREQSYPIWTRDNVVDIGMSKALSTNVLHFRAMEVASTLAGFVGNTELQTRYATWANELKSSIQSRLWLEEEGMFSTFITTTLDPAPTRRFDLLGLSLAILNGVATPEQAKMIVERYPHYGPGAPVMWPQQQDVPIYHNRGEWPFVTAYWLRAAALANNDAVVERMIQALIRGAALNLSNMENFEAGSGKPYLEDYEASGPVVNSQRQLWSVAGYISMVQHTLFGLHSELTANGRQITIAPYLTRGLRSTLFKESNQLVLNDAPFSGKTITIVLHLPEDQGTGAAYKVTQVLLNGSLVDDATFTAAELADQNRVDITLALDDTSQAATLTDVDDSNYQMVFAPRSPVIDRIDLQTGQIQLNFSIANESDNDISFHIYRDGEHVADLPGNVRIWIDPDTQPDVNAGVCYIVEASYLVSGNRSQHSPPNCWWRTDYSTIKNFDVQSFTAVGGMLVNNHGRWHYENWGDMGHSLTIENVTAVRNGSHLLQVEYSNGAGAINTGITCALKRLVIEEQDSGLVVAEGALMMPHLGTWERWAYSNFVRADLELDKNYRVRIESTELMSNMSALSHFEEYTAGLGGVDGPYNRVNISELKLLSR